MISLLAYATFRGQLCFGRIYFFTLFQSSYFDKQLVFGGSCFFRTAAVFPFYKTVTFSQELFFQNSFFSGAKILQSSQFLRIGNSLRQLLFGTAFFFSEELPCFKKELLFQSTASTRKNRFFRKSISALPTFSGERSFRATTFSKDATFYSSFLFKRDTFLQHTFSEELLFHSYGSFPQLHLFLFVSNSVNSVAVKGSLSAGVLSCVCIIAQSRIIDG